MSARHKVSIQLPGLPLEMLVLIFDFCDVRTVLQAVTCCRGWYRSLLPLLTTSVTLSSAQNACDAYAQLGKMRSCNIQIESEDFSERFLRLPANTASFTWRPNRINVFFWPDGLEFPARLSSLNTTLMIPMRLDHVPLIALNITNVPATLPNTLTSLDIDVDVGRHPWDPMYGGVASEHQRLMSILLKLPNLRDLTLGSQHAMYGSAYSDCISLLQLESYRGAADGNEPIVLPKAEIISLALNAADDAILQINAPRAREITLDLYMPYPVVKISAPALQKVTLGLGLNEVEESSLNDLVNSIADFPILPKFVVMVDSSWFWRLERLIVPCQPYVTFAEYDYM